jgi:hypothetical protein
MPAQDLIPERPQSATKQMRPHERRDEHLLISLLPRLFGKKGRVLKHIFYFLIGQAGSCSDFAGKIA